MNTCSTPVIRSLLLACTAAVLAAGCSKSPEPSLTVTPVATTTIGTELDDSVVTTRVKSVLLGDPDIKSFEIKVETRKGMVQLSGFVDTQIRIDSAIALVRKVEGVKGIENGMSLKDGKATVGNTVDDGIVTTKIKSALLTDPSVKSFDIAVVTRKGEVQLSGFVDSQTQIDHAVTLVRAVDGVQSVTNEMSIKK